jgi:transcriptional regulator with XRE-family HTH domain
LSQEALADAAHIGRSYMSGIERGVRNCSTLHLLRVARALHVSVGDLFSRSRPDG